LKTFIHTPPESQCECDVTVMHDESAVGLAETK